MSPDHIPKGANKADVILDPPPSPLSSPFRFDEGEKRERERERERERDVEELRRATEGSVAMVSSGKRPRSSSRRNVLLSPPFFVGGSNGREAGDHGFFMTFLSFYS